jgi:subtilisin family serine protease
VVVETPVTPTPEAAPFPGNAPNSRPGQLNVLLREGADADTVAGRHGGQVLSSIPALNTALFGFPAGTDMAAKTAEVLADPDVIGVEANGLIQPPEATTEGTDSLTVPDPNYGYEVVGELAPGCVTPTGIIVAVIDTGIDPTHPAFAGRLTSDGWNVLDDNANFQDVANGVDDDGDGLIDEMYGHGTHVAGIIARIAPTVKILPIKALNDEGIGDSFGVATGIVYAYDHGARVINLSLSSTQESAVIDRAIQAARERGVVVVASAGNSGVESPKEYPSASPGVIGVASTGPGDVKSPFSNYGAELSMSAPGTGIESAIPGGGYGEASGTSMAAPFVTAAVALVMEQNPAMTVDDIEALIESTSASLDVTNPGYVGKLGSGRLDITAAVDCGTS